MPRYSSKFCYLDSRLISFCPMCPISGCENGCVGRRLRRVCRIGRYAIVWIRQRTWRCGCTLSTADMTATTISIGAHTHPELQSGIETTQALLAQVLDGQATILDTLNVQAESQARMQTDISEMKTAIGELQSTVGELQSTVGDVARGLAVVQADVALLVARDS